MAQKSANEPWMWLKLEENFLISNPMSMASFLYSVLESERIRTEAEKVAEGQDTGNKSRVVPHPL